jgi:hypothetical protein
MAEINARARDVETEVRTCLQQQRYQLTLVEERLVAAVRQLREKKEKILSSHREAFDLYLANVKSSCDFTQRILSEGTAAEVLATKVQIKRQLQLLSEKELSEKLPVDASLHFYANTQALSEIIDAFASVTASSSFPPLCQAEGLRFAFVGLKSQFRIITFDQVGERRDAGGDHIAIKVERPSEAKTSSLSASADDNSSVEIEDLADGTYMVSFCPSTSGVLLIHVDIQVTPISSSPFKVVCFDSEAEARRDPTYSSGDVLDGYSLKHVATVPTAKALATDGDTEERSDFA